MRLPTRASEPVSDFSNEQNKPFSRLAAASFGCAALATVAFSIMVGYAALRPMSNAASDQQFARAGVDCPAGPAIFDPAALQAAIDDRLQALPPGLPAKPDDPAATQWLVCQLLLQNPRRGLAWQQLLAATPKAVGEPAFWAQLFQISYDLSRSHPDAARGRLNLAAPRWPILTKDQRHIVLADARLLLLVKDHTMSDVTQLALRGPQGGAELMKEFRALVMELAPGSIQNFDVNEKIATGKMRIDNSE